jgi:hypothetical protein
LKKIYIDILKNAVTEKLSKEDFLVELERTPDDFCSLRMKELDRFAEEVVWECIKVVEKEDYNGAPGHESKYSRLIRERFGIE